MYISEIGGGGGSESLRQSATSSGRPLTQRKSVRAKPRVKFTRVADMVSAGKISLLPHVLPHPGKR